MYDLRHHLIGLTDDQAAACALYAAGLERFYQKPCIMAIRVVLDPVGAKTLSTALKSLGQHACPRGAILCEANVLQGRGIAPLNLRHEALDRIGSKGMAKTPRLFSDTVLRRCISTILNTELNMTDPIEFEDPDKFWAKRWLWCVNGGHSRALERHEPKWAVTYKGRIHRRVAMEHWAMNPLTEWSGNVYVSSSEKLEHGKNRLLLACDTVSYVCFEHLLGPVEKAWKGKRVVLDPGGGGRIGIARRVRNMGTQSIYVMLDYDDFNSQHTLRAQELVIDELCTLTGYDGARANKLKASFYKMLIHSGDEVLGYASATLMSGHRATSFLNSVLNAAYIMAADEAQWASMKSIHIGDDVVVACAGFSDADRLLMALKRTGIRMNPGKQSTGDTCAELLRMAITPTYAIGYYARSVASVVSGNWTSDTSLTDEERIRTMVTSARSLINRCDSNLPACILADAASKRAGVGVRAMRELMVGNATLGAGPTFNVGPTVHTYELVRNQKHAVKKGEQEHLPAAATVDYLSKSTTEVERCAMSLAGASVRETMIHTSYAKSLAGLESEDARRGACVRLEKRSASAVSGWAYDKDVNVARRYPGALGKYPLLHLLRSRLTKKIVMRLLEMVGVPPGHDWSETAWGCEAHGVRIVGTLPYADAAAICSSTLHGVIYVTYPIYM
jgi:hypothetical protein